MIDSDKYCEDCCNDHAECYCFIDDEDEDTYFGEIETCNTRGCIVFGAHFESDCHTTEDAERYYEEMEALNNTNLQIIGRD